MYKKIKNEFKKNNLIKLKINYIKKKLLLVIKIIY